MIVYHYLNRQFGLESIRRRRLRVSIVHKLKDPFEHRALLLTEEQERFFDKMLEDMAKPDAERPNGQGIICFSETCESPVMWSMYADDHQGVCLGFEIPEHLLYQVEYVPRRVNTHGLNMHSMQACIMFKFDGWAYERERRLLAALREDQREGEHFFVGYEHQLALREVVVGIKSTITRNQVTEAIGDLAGQIEVHRAKRSLNDFAMIRDTGRSW